MKLCIEMVIPLLCTGLPQCFFSTDFGGVGDMIFTQREQISGAEGGLDSRKGRAEVESAFTGDVVCCWPHLWVGWRCVGEWMVLEMLESRGQSE